MGPLELCLYFDTGKFTTPLALLHATLLRHLLEKAETEFRKKQLHSWNFRTSTGSCWGHIALPWFGLDIDTRRLKKR